MATTKAFELGQLGSKLTIHSENITLDGNVHGQYAGFDSDFTVSIAGINSGSLSEGTNLYYTDARADARIAAADTGDLSEGSNLYYTDARADARVSLIVDAAPGTLNTLNELAAALGDDANFSTTVTNSIATKLPLAGGTMTGNIAHAGDFTIDAGGNITLDADGGSVFFKDAGTEFFKIRNTGSDVQIYSARSDADIKFEGVDGGVGITALRLDMSEGGRAYFANGFKVSDTQKAFFGDGNDLEIYHDGNNSYINDAGTGALLVRGSNVSIAKYTGETMINAFADGRVDLYYDNAIKLTTTTTGIDVTGTVTSDGLTVDGQAIIDGGTGVASTGVLHVRQNGNGEGNGIAITSSNATSHRIWKDANGKLNIGPASSPSAFVQDLNGNIGIGTDSPSSILHVTDGGAGLEVIPQTANDRTTLLSYDRNTSTYQTLDTDSLDMHFNLSGIERMRINTDGDISLASGGRFYFGGANRATSTNAQAYIKETGLNLDIKGNDNVRLLGDGGNVILHADYTGNVGIGTDSPARLLHLQGNDGASGTTPGNSDTQLFIDNNGGNGSILEFGASNDSQSWIMFSDEDTANQGRIQYAHSNDTMYFSTAQDRRMQISASEVVFNDDSRNQDFRVESDSNQHAMFLDASYSSTVCFGTSNINLHNTNTPGVILGGNGNVGQIIGSTSGNRPLILHRYTNIGMIAEFGYNTATVGSIYVTASGTTYNTTSDRRLKDNIEPISDATDKLMDMKPVTHTWIDNPDDPQVHGFIAQEMQEVVPEAVSGDAESDEMMSMDYGRITPVIVAALQDALNEIKELKTRIDKLENN